MSQNQFEELGQIQWLVLFENLLKKKSGKEEQRENNVREREREKVRQNRKIEKVQKMRQWDNDREKVRVG